MRAIWIPVTMILVLQGCSGMEPRTRPAPVGEPGDKPPTARPAARSPQPALPEPAQPEPVERTREVEVYAYRAAAAPTFQPSRPVQALLDRAEALRAAGDLAGAAATLERALRIEPRNAHLWNRLARVRLEQKQYAQAESLAAKSNSLAGEASTLKRDNGGIIAMARKASGTGR